MIVSQERVDRRTVLATGGALAALTLPGCSSSRAGQVSDGQRVTAAGPDWNGFRRGLDGRLFRPGEPGYPAAHQLFNPRFDSVRPAGVVRIASVDDIRESVLFARRSGVACVPRSGGHSYVGASTVGDGLVIDVGAARGISYANEVVTVGAGATLYDVHVALDRHGRSLPTGTCPTVGLAGLALGGGLGVHTRSYGLTSDRVLSLQVVTADGVFRAVSPTQEPDLYWALRGGGGGNLAVVTALRLATIPATELGFFRLSWPAASAAAVLRGWQRFAREAPASAWANLHLDARSNGLLSVRATGVSTTGSAAAAAAQLESFAGSQATGRSITVKSHLEAVRYLGGGTSSPRTGSLAGSDVLRGPMDAATIGAVVAAVGAAGRAGVAAAVILDPLGAQAAKQPAGGSAWPWRSALGVVQWYAGLPAHPGTAKLRAAQKFVGSGHRAVAKVSAGGYVNYLESGRPVPSYYGDSLTRLSAVKQKYDPGNFFHTPHTYP